MTANEIRRRFPKASFAFIQANAETDHPLSSPVVECRPVNEPLATAQVEKGNPGRVSVVVTSYRRRLLDEDNLCEKFHVDCCRYAGILSSDAPDKTSIQVRQVKVKTKEEERTEIEINTFGNDHVSKKQTKQNIKSNQHII